MKFLKEADREFEYYSAHSAAAIIRSDHKVNPIFVLHRKVGAYPYAIFRDGLSPIGGRSGPKDASPLDTLLREMIDEELQGDLGRLFADVLGESTIRPYLEILTVVPKELINRHEDIHSRASIFEITVDHGFLEDLMTKAGFEDGEIYIKEEDDSRLPVEFFTLKEFRSVDMSNESFIFCTGYLLSHYLYEKFGVTPNFSLLEETPVYNFGPKELVEVPFSQRDLSKYRPNAFSD